MATRSLHPASGLIPPPSSGGHRTSADAPGPAKTTLLLSDKVRILVFCLPSRGSLSAHGLLPAPGPLPVCGSFPSRSSLPTPTHLPASDSRPFRGLSPRTSPLFLGPEPFLPPSGAESRPPGARSVGKAGPQLSSPCREERTGRCANLSPPLVWRNCVCLLWRRAIGCRGCSRVRRSAHLPAGTIACRPAPAFVVPPHPMPAGGAVSVRPRSRRRGGERAVLRRTKVASRTGPPFSAAFSGAVSPRFFLLPPDGSGRHMTYRNRAIVPPRCGLQRAGSVPPRSAERRAVRRPRSGRATAGSFPPVHGFRPSCGTDAARRAAGCGSGRTEAAYIPRLSARPSRGHTFAAASERPERLLSDLSGRPAVLRPPFAMGRNTYKSRLSDCPE